MGQGFKMKVAAISILLATATSAARADIVVYGGSSGGGGWNHMAGYSDMSFLWAVPVFDIQMLNLPEYTYQPTPLQEEPEIVVTGAPQQQQPDYYSYNAPSYYGFDPTYQPDPRGYETSVEGCQYAPICLPSELEWAPVDDSPEALAEDAQIQAKVDEAEAVLQGTVDSLTPEQRASLVTKLEDFATTARPELTTVALDGEPNLAPLQTKMAEILVDISNYALQNQVIIPDASTPNVTGQDLYNYYFAF